MFTNHDNWSEKELLQNIAAGDQKAFATLLNRFSDLLGAYIFKITHSRETAEEVVQDVFVKIWNNREKLPEINNFKVWLFVVSRNQALSALRKSIKERKEIESFIPFSLNINIDESDEEKFTALEKAIELLPPQQKKAYILCRKNGFSHKKVAEQMGLSKETVKKHLQYANQFILVKVRDSTIMLLVWFYLFF